MTGTKQARKGAANSLLGKWPEEMGTRHGAATGWVLVGLVLVVAAVGLWLLWPHEAPATSNAVATRAATTEVSRMGPRRTVQALLEAVRANDAVAAKALYQGPEGEDAEYLGYAIDLLVAMHRLSQASVRRFGPEPIAPEDMRDATIDAAIAQLADAPLEEGSEMTVVMVSCRGPTEHFPMFQAPIRLVPVEGGWKIYEPLLLADARRIAFVRLGAEVTEAGARDILAGKYDTAEAAREGIKKALIERWAAWRKEQGQ